MALKTGGFSLTALPTAPQGVENLGRSADIVGNVSRGIASGAELAKRIKMLPGELEKEKAEVELAKVKAANAQKLADLETQYREGQMKLQEASLKKDEKEIEKIGLELEQTKSAMEVTRQTIAAISNAGTQIAGGKLEEAEKPQPSQAMEEPGTEAQKVSGDVPAAKPSSTVLSKSAPAVEVETTAAPALAGKVVAPTEEPSALAPVPEAAPSAKTLAGKAVGEAPSVPVQEKVLGAKDPAIARIEQQEGAEFDPKTKNFLRFAPDAQAGEPPMQVGRFVGIDPKTGRAKVDYTTNPQYQVWKSEQTQKSMTEELEQRGQSRIAQDEIKAARKEVQKLVDAKDLPDEEVVRLVPTLASLKTQADAIDQDAKSEKLLRPIAVTEARKEIKPADIASVKKDLGLSTDAEAIRHIVQRRTDSLAAEQSRLQQEAQYKRDFERGEDLFKNMPDEQRKQIAAIPQTQADVQDLKKAVSNLNSVLKTKDAGDARVLANAMQTVLRQAQAQPGDLSGALAFAKSYLGSVGDEDVKKAMEAVLTPFSRITANERNRLFGATLTNNELAYSGMAVGNLGLMLTDPEYATKFVNNLETRIDKAYDNLSDPVKAYLSKVNKEYGKKPEAPATSETKPSGQPSPTNDTKRQEALAWLKSNPNHPRAAEVKKLLGL